KTLEVLETKGVPVVVYSADVLPAFWSRQSQIKAPLRLDSADAIASFQTARDAIGVIGGMLIANPIPEVSEIPAEIMGKYINEAISRATNKGVTGKAVTPFLLSALLDITNGESLKANIALVENNARLAARIAVSLAKGSTR
ncbi:MAG TPA: pseudouridine-5'-phosphate glycosidase, partial [Phyllobacterium sp.]|nr:pseudouridine-5'-phosphate glycosidase [Phyllobacterium sp.]